MTQAVKKNNLKTSSYSLNYLKTEHFLYKNLFKRAKNTPALNNHRGRFCQKKFAARYLDPKTSRWLSTDPAMGEYVPSAPVNKEAKKRNGNLPGMGGVFNYVNFHVYHYAGNNPVRYIDPTGRDAILTNKPVDADPTNIIEHMGAFFQDKEKKWYFFYWGADVKYKEINDTSIFEDVEKMNLFLFNEGLNPNGDRKPYRDFVYIEGDFTESHKTAVDLFNQYNNSLSNWNGKGLSNGYYNFFTRNCGHETMNLFKLGTLPNNVNVGEYMVSYGFKNNLIPNITMNRMQKLFGNKSFNYKSFIQYERKRK